MGSESESHCCFCHVTAVGQNQLTEPLLPADRVTSLVAYTCKLYQLGGWSCQNYKPRTLSNKSKQSNRGDKRFFFTNHFQCDRSCSSSAPQPETSEFQNGSCSFVRVKWYRSFFASLLWVINAAFGGWFVNYLCIFLFVLLTWPPLVFWRESLYVAQALLGHIILLTVTSAKNTGRRAAHVQWRLAISFLNTF